MKKLKRKISERRLEAALGRLLDRWLERRGGVRTFEEAGVLSMNRGLVLSLGNGQEFQLTIVDSTR